MFHAHIPLKYWHDVFQSIIFVINHLPSSTISFDTPFQLLFHKPPDNMFFKVLSCKCYSYAHPYSSHKLEPRSIPCAFLGYTSVYKGYKYLDLATNYIYIFRHVVFNEFSFPFKTVSSTDTDSVTSDRSYLFIPYK
jgi:hypothetical protein